MKKLLILTVIFVACAGIVSASDVQIKTAATIIAEQAAYVTPTMIQTPATTSGLPPLPPEANTTPSTTTSGSTYDKIKAKVDSYLSGNVQPIVQDKPTGLTLEKKYEKVRLSKDDPGTLIALNAVGGIFEGAIVGLSCGSLGYAKDYHNADIRPIINGTFIGIGSGVIGSTILSIVELNTDKYYFSSDYGIDTLGGCVIGGIMGTCGGVISYIKTKSTDNILEGVGYGATIGTALGFVTAVVEMVIPSQYRGVEIKENHALNIEVTPDSTLLTYTIKY